MITKAGRLKRYKIGGLTIDERRLRQVFIDHCVTPLNPDQFRALLFDVLVEHLATGRPPSAETISEVLTDTCRDQDDLDAAVHRKQLRLKCQTAHTGRVYVEGERVYGNAEIEETDRRCEQLDGNRDASTTNSDDQNSAVLRLVAERDAVDAMLRQDGMLAKLCAIQVEAAQHIEGLLDGLGDLGKKSLTVDPPDYGRIDELKSVTARSRRKIDAELDDSPETRADLENDEQELCVLRVIRDDQHLPLVVQTRLVKLLYFFEDELRKLLL